MKPTEVLKVSELNNLIPGHLRVRQCKLKWVVKYLKHPAIRYAA